MRSPPDASLWRLTEAAGAWPTRFLLGDDGKLHLAALQTCSTLGLPRAELRGAVVLLLAAGQQSIATALLELDGLARRLVLCPPDLEPRHLPFVLATSEAAWFVADTKRPDLAALGLRHLPLGNAAVRCTRADATIETEWVLFTSGTTGRPKLVVHTLRSLIGAIDGPCASAGDVVWSTFYDIRRYGGLQILLRALVGGASMVLSRHGEPAAAFLERAAAAAVSHISGTPSHWRNAMLSAPVPAFAPRYVRLSGEAADQAILDRLRDRFRGATVAHAFASTEAGVAFEVRDGRAGIPAELIRSGAPDVEMRIQDGTLRIRSSRTACHYLGDQADRLLDEDGFVDTADVLELHGGRYQFVGRADGVINVGGFKVHPEEVEAVINRHPDVHLSRVKGRRSPMTGAVVAAEVVTHLRPGHAAGSRALETEIIAACRDVLPWYKVPATVRFVPVLAVSAAGKLQRTSA